MMPQKDHLPVMDPALVQAFQTNGLVLMGISDLEPFSTREDYYQSWIQEGNQGEMSYLERHSSLKYHPDRILPGCRTVLVVGLSYWQEGFVQPNQGKIARYAWGRDYHKVLGKSLTRIAKDLEARYPNETFRGFTDATPLDERYFAERAGAGFMGKNNLLISSVYGSWFFLGELLTTKTWPRTQIPEGIHGACPKGCRKCLDVCPTGALVDEYKMDPRLCISYLTIEYKGSIPLELRPKMGSWIFGCDLCQEVCPIQLRKKTTSVVDFTAWKAGPGVSLFEILTMNIENFVKKFAGTPVMRTGLESLQRNACIAAGNLRDQASLEPLKGWANSTHSLLKEHAQWALNQWVEGVVQ